MKTNENFLSFLEYLGARVNSDTEEKLKELVSERIRRIDRITGTVTVIIAREIEGSSRE